MRVDSGRSIRSSIRKIRYRGSMKDSILVLITGGTIDDLEYIRANAASLKKFYTFMVERGETEPKDLDILKEDITEEMDEWLAELRRFDRLADVAL